MSISAELLSVLVCPVTKSALRYDQTNQELISEEAKLAYPVIDGIPIMLIDHARNIA